MTKAICAIICRYQQRIVRLWYQRNGGDAQGIENLLGPLIIIITTTTTSTVPTATYHWMATMDPILDHRLILVVLCMDQIAAEIEVLQFCR